MPDRTGWSALADKTRDRRDMLLTYAEQSLFAAAAFLIVAAVFGLASAWGYGGLRGSDLTALALFLAAAAYSSMRAETLNAHASTLSVLAMLYDQEARHDA